MYNVEASAIQVYNSDWKPIVGQMLEKVYPQLDQTAREEKSLGINNILGQWF